MVLYKCNTLYIWRWNFLLETFNSIVIFSDARWKGVGVPV
jgi:hypothetical protein